MKAPIILSGGFSGQIVCMAAAVGCHRRGGCKSRETNLFPGVHVMICTCLPKTTLPLSMLQDSCMRPAGGCTELTFRMVCWSCVVSEGLPWLQNSASRALIFIGGDSVCKGAADVVGHQQSAAYLGFICTIGCSNPACVELRGASEVKVSCKACTGCKVVCYCSRECQVAHWKVHRGICKKLAGSNPGGSESKKGGGKLGAAGEVAASK